MRPHYEPAELDGECEAIITAFLRTKHGKVGYPVITNDLVILVEQEAADLDTFADLSTEGDDVEGVTYFRPNGKPDVKIAGRLATNPSAANRFRTTLSHELGHVKFHNFLWPLEAGPELFPQERDDQRPPAPPKCRRQMILNAPAVDWMEWQAGYACGAFLMPLTALTAVVRRSLEAAPWAGPIALGTPEAAELIATVRRAFDVSADAASVRLARLGYLVPPPATPDLLAAPGSH